MSDDGVIFTVDAEVELEEIERRLGSLRDKAPKVLSKAINDTAKWATRELAAAAQKRYRVQKVKFSREFDIDRASPGKQEATLTAKGGTLPAADFKATPKTPKPSSHGSPATKLAIVKEGSPRVITSNRGSGLQTFIARFQSGHIAVVQREPPRKYKSAGWSARKSAWAEYLRKTGHLDDTRIQELYGPSVPMMLYKAGVTDEYIESQEPKILEHLQQSITKYINTELYFASKR